MSWKIKVFVFLMVASSVQMTASAVVYVDAAATGSGNGFNWANAYITLKGAVDASPSNSEIWVAAGTYYPSLTMTDRTDSIVLKSGMKVYGGFLRGMTLRSQRDWEANPTILSGDINVKNNHSDNSNHILIGAAYSVVDGVTIERGGDTAYTQEDGEILAFGGGLALMNIGAAGMRLENVVFKNNNVYYGDGAGRPGTFGGAIYATNSALEVVSCTFDNNLAQKNGGAIYLLNPEGGSSLSAVVSNCTFRMNMTRMGGEVDGGGAIWAQAGNLSIEACTFIANRSAINDLTWGSGAAILLASSTDVEANPAKISDCVFAANYTGTGQGGAIHAAQDVEVKRCIFSQNYSTTQARGGAIYVGTSAVAEIRESVFSANYAVQNVPFITWGMGGNMEQGQGGAIAAAGTAHAINCVFAGNYSSSEDGRNSETFLPNGTQGGGGAFWQQPSSNGGSVLENCTFAGNRANKYGGAVYADKLTNDVVLLNCISWDNEAWLATRIEPDTCDELYGDSITVRYSDVAGGWEGTGEGNLDVDPQFASGLDSMTGPFMGTWTASPTYDPATGLTTLTDANASWKPGEHAGRFLEPTLTAVTIVAPKNWGAPDYTNVVSGLKFPIFDNTKTTVRVYGNATQITFYWRQNLTLADVDHDYRIYDYHLKAIGSRWLPPAPSSKRWAVDTVHSPCIDAGDKASDYSLEPYPNGNRINMGAYGNTKQASSKAAGSMMLCR